MQSGCVTVMNNFEDGTFGNWKLEDITFSASNMPFSAQATGLTEEERAFLEGPQVSVRPRN